MIVRCKQCGSSHAVDDGFAVRPTTSLCPECGSRCRIGELRESDVHATTFKVTKGTGEEVTIADLAEIQAMLATGVLEPTDVLQGPGHKARFLEDIEGFAPFLTSEKPSRMTPSYGVPIVTAPKQPASDPPSEYRTSLGLAPRFSETL